MLTAELQLGIMRPDGADAAAVLAHLNRLTKPPGSLGALERVALRLALIYGDPPPPLTRRTIIVMAADHGVAARGVSAYPQEVTRQMCSTCARGAAAVSVLARASDAVVRLIDVGVTGDPMPDVETCRVRSGSADLSVGPALTRAEVMSAIRVGIDAAERFAATTDIFGIGEIGIGNTTAAAALTSAFTGAGATLTVGRGTGIGDAALEAKREIVNRAVARVQRSADPIDVLAQVGGLEIAALTGVILSAAASRRAVVLDGFIATAAALPAALLAPETRDFMFASHVSAEPGHAVQLEWLGLEPLLALDLRLGEGTGAALALPIIDGAGALLREMATFESAGVSGSVQ